MALFFKSLAKDALMSLQFASGTIQDVLYKFFNIHGEASRVYITLVAVETSLFVIMDSDTPKNMSPLDSQTVYGSYKTDKWKPINTASLMLASDSSPDALTSKVQTFCRLQGSSYLPKVVAGQSDFSQQVYLNKIKVAIVAEWSKTYDDFWPRLCPSEPMTITISIPQSRRKNFTVVPWTSSRSCKASKWPLLVSVNGFCQWTSSTLFELGLDAISNDIVARNFDGTSLKDSLAIKDSWSPSFTDTDVGSFSPPKPRRYGKQATKSGAAAVPLAAAVAPVAAAAAIAVAPVAAPAIAAAPPANEGQRKRRKIEDRSSSPVVGVLYTITTMGGGGGDPTLNFMDRLMTPHACAVRADMDRSCLTLEMVSRVNDFTKVCYRVWSSITAAYSKDSAPKEWAVGVFRSDSSPASSCEVGYLEIGDIMVPVLAINIYHPLISSDSLLVGSASILWSKITSIDSSIVLSMASGPKTESFPGLCGSSLGPAGGGAGGAGAPATDTEAAAAAAVASALSQFDFGIESFGAGEFGDGGLSAYLASFDPAAPAAASHFQPPQSFGADDKHSKLVPLVESLGPYQRLPAFNTPWPIDRNRNYSILFKTWQCIAQSGWMPAVTSIDSSRAKTLKLHKIGVALRGGSFAKPPKGTLQRGGGRNREISSKLIPLLEELLDAAANGVSHEDVFSLIDNEPPFKFFVDAVKDTGSASGGAASGGAGGPF